MIKVLDSQVIDQIAAGEVIERPAQLVKELVENALDAEATEIEVDFSCGGKFVQAKDNGKGIHRADLKLALARHATSKISQADDLWALSSYGFRGEALASIAAVAKVRLTSKTIDQKKAYELLAEFGRFFSVEEASHDVGTTVQVSDLFTHLPARLKFLKSDSAEHLQIKKVLKALAMTRPNVSFRVRQDNKILFFWPKAKTWKDRVEAVVEKAGLNLIEYEFNGFKLRAVLSAPNDTTKTAKNIWFFVQQRWVQDRSLQSALMDGYRSFLMHGEYPHAVVWLEVDSQEVDVNIHPSKSQVKFLNASDAYRVVLRATKKLMDAAPWLEGLTPQLESKNQKTIKVEGMNSFQFGGKDFDRTNYQSKKFNLQEVRDSFQKYEALEDHKNSTPLMGSSSTGLASVDTSVIDTSTVDSSREESGGAPPTDLNKELSFWRQLQVIGQSKLTYIVAQSDRGLVFIDQHAAHERVAYERLMKAWLEQRIEVQNFLLPESIDMDEAEIEAIQKVRLDLEALGLFVDVVGPTTLAIRAAPLLVKGRALKDVLDKTATEVLANENSFAFESVVRDLCATMACHSVVRAGQSLSLEQMNSLLEQMDEFPNSSFCPHGRPVYVEYSFNELERDFGRVL